MPIEDWDGRAFHGAKLALISRGRVLTLLRDDTPSILFPDHWDLPGGGREDGESPTECVLRETKEEFGIDVSQVKFDWAKLCRDPRGGDRVSWFFGADMPELKQAHINFGDEGQEWRLMPIRQYLMHPKAVPNLAERLAAYVSARKG